MDRLLSTFMVTNLNESGAHSLRAGIQSGDATIAFAPGLHGTITLKSELPITGSVTINGPGADRLSVSGKGASRIFDISDEHRDWLRRPVELRLDPRIRARLLQSTQLFLAHVHFSALAPLFLSALLTRSAWIL
jgi:hypothetical protein